MTNPTLAILAPQVILAASACLLLLVVQQRPVGKTWTGVIGVSVFIAAGAGKALISPGGSATGIAEIAVDAEGDSLQWIMLAVGGLFAAMLSQRAGTGRSAVECAAMLLLSTAGGLLVAIADDLVLLTVALALVFLPLILVLFVSERERTADEATLKFAIISGLSLSLTMLAFALLYAVSGTTTLSAMNLDGTADANHAALCSVAFILLITGLAIPLTAVPFHFAMVDIIDGVDGWTAGVMSLLPRLAAAAALLRICQLPSPVETRLGTSLLLVLAVTTLLGGGLMALTQTRIHRQFANLGIAQSGWWLLGLAVILWWAGQGDGPELAQARAAWIGQLWATSIALAGLSAAFVYLGGSDGKCQFIDELAGLARTYPTLAVAVTLFLFSIAGIPPLIGFWSQATLLWAALAAHVPSTTSLLTFHRGFVSAAGAGLVGGLVITAIAIRTVSLMFFHPPLSKPLPRHARGAHIVAIALALTILAAGLFPQALWNRLIDQ